jgi:galactokinase
MDRARTDRFAERFGASPTHLVRAPGRVNLIGEHTDYNGLPVFPMAIPPAVVLAVRPRLDPRVRLSNADARYAPREFEIGTEIAPFPAGDWGNYAKAAAQALARRVPLFRGFDALIEGDIPEAAGLSSSSALVVACSLALLAANGAELDPRELMALAASAERYVGTQSGGMDQAICLGGREGRAVLIEFEPLRLRPTPVPSDWRFVVANTFVEARKSGAAQAAYNARVRECAEALRAIGFPARGYRDLAATHPLGELLEAAEKKLPDPLRRRFRHVVTEAARVEDARAAMLEGDLEAFGRLMDASHASLRDDYDVSCPELDALVELARGAGAAGARLTGAGFGGCIVALCRASRLEGLLAGLEGAAPIAVRPSDGARVFEL